MVDETEGFGTENVIHIVRSPPQVEVKPEPKNTIVIYESLRDSIISDSYTFAMLMLVMGIGKFVGSDAIVWIGALMFLFGVMFRTIAASKRYTIDEARAELDRIEKEIKGGD
jgi:hypothetical protein